ncbi:hypothetical protein FSARC_13401, partial [Fusarium sarcochroum]
MEPFAKPQGQADKGNARMELPSENYVSGTKMGLFTLRNGKLNREGKAEQIEVNQYRDQVRLLKEDLSVFISPNPDKVVPVMTKKRDSV